MVATQLAARGVKDPRVLEAMGALPRERFVPEDQRLDAYEDHPLPIGFDSTISQPFMVGYMTEKLGLLGPERVLEIGTGSGYQTALLAKLAQDVYSVEIEEDLALRAGALIRELGLRNVHLRIGDGFDGWKEKAPFDRILMTCGVDEPPAALKEQVRVGGWLLAPVGADLRQTLRQYIRLPGGFQTVDWMPVSFLPLRRKR